MTNFSVKVIAMKPTLLLKSRDLGTSMRLPKELPHNIHLGIAQLSNKMATLDNPNFDFFSFLRLDYFEQQSYVPQIF